MLLRWLLQRDASIVVKSTRPERLRENLDVFDFELNQDQIGAIAAMDRQEPLAGFTHQDPRMPERLLTFD